MHDTGITQSEESPSLDLKEEDPVLGLDEVAYKKVIEGAVGTIPTIVEITDSIEGAGYDQLLMVGSGGQYGAMLGVESIARERTTMRVRAAIAAELVLQGDPSVNDRTVALLASLSGTTTETIEAAKWCKERGATVIGLTGFEDTPLAEFCDHLLINEADNSTAAESINIQVALLITRMLSLRGEFGGWEDLAEQVATLPEGMWEAHRAADPVVSKYAEEHVDTDYYFLAGAGNLWGETYIYSMCVLEEMQWLHTTRVHGAEFFHGSLELIERDTSILLLVGEDRSRPLMERVERFCRNYNDDTMVLDTKLCPLPGVDAGFRDILIPTMMGVITDRLSVHLERVRNHSLDLRRYYRTVEY